MLTKFGAIITDGRGKIGSFYIGKNHYGTYLAEIVPPANQQTTFQQLRRQQQAYLSANWPNLTDSQQREWEGETVNYPRTNSIGNTYFLTGQTLYIALNLNLWMVGSGFIDAPVTKNIPLPCGSFTIAPDVTGGTYIITFAIPPIDANTIYVLFTTDGLSTGIFYVSTKYRSTSIHAADATNNWDIYTPWSNIFRFAAVGKKTFLKIMPIDLNCGCPGIPFFASEVIA